jgi:signal recognition particle subunit SRP14
LQPVSYQQDLPEPTNDSDFLDLHPPRSLPIIIRATDGKGRDKRKERVKLSTVVDADALAGFFDRYADVCKTGMTTLKPRDRSKRKTKGKKKKMAAPAAAT